MKTGALIRNKPYEFNPHRHVKIWLSKNPDVFMNEQNQLRLVRMRVDCPNDEINLIYESQLLSEDAQCALLGFCSRHDVNVIDVRKIISLCEQDSEQQLIKIYEDEISHLDAGGNLAAASDILRWLEPVYSLGTYSDFDVKVRTKGLPETIPVFGEMLFNIGSVLTEEDNEDFQRESVSCSNDIIAVLNPRSERIKATHQFIINACGPRSDAPQMVGYLPESFHGEAKQYNRYLTKLRSMYVGKTAREWRSNIPEFIQCLNELIKKGGNAPSVYSVKNQYYETTGLSKILKLWDKYSGDSSILHHDLYMDSVIRSTGPASVINLFTQMDYKTRNYFICACSLSSYKPIFRAFYSPQSAFLRMSQKDRKHRVGGDLSWLETGQSRIAERENKSRNNAKKIQKTWTARIAAQERRLMLLKARIARDPELVHSTLLLAASRGDHKIVKFLIDEGADINLVTQCPAEHTNHNENNRSPLDWAMLSGHIPTILILINAGATANYSHSMIKERTLSNMLKRGQLVGVQILIKLNKLLLNQIDSNGYTPLHYAALYGHIEIARYLIAEGADLNLAVSNENINHHNMTALGLAIRRGYDSVAIFLFEAGAHVPSVVNGRQQHLIHIVAKKGLFNHVQALIKHNPVLVHVRDRYNQTALLWAASSGHHEIVAFLITHGAYVHVATDHAEDCHHQYSPLDWAIERGHVATISILVKAGAIESGFNLLHELHQPLAGYFETPQGIALLDCLLKHNHVKNVLVPFLDGEYLTQAFGYVENLARIMLSIIEMNIEEYTSAQVIDVIGILRPYDVCEHLEALVQYQKGMFNINDDSIMRRFTQNLSFPGLNATINSSDIIQYHRQNKNILIDCIDFCFNELEKCPHDELSKKLTQKKFGKAIVKEGNIYAVYRYFEILKGFSESELSQVLTLKNKDGKTISHYLLESRFYYSEGLVNQTEEYILNTYISLLQKVDPGVRSMILRFESQTEETLSERLMRICENNAETLCGYLVLLENELSCANLIAPLSQQLVFEHIINMTDSPEKDKLINLALSNDSALHAFIIYIPDGRINSFLMYSIFQHLHPYIWALSELKKPTEQQSNPLISATMRFFLPAPLDATKLDKSEFGCGIM